MAYKIHYTPEAAKRYSQTVKKRDIKLGKWIVLALIIASVLWVRVNGVPDVLIPGDPEVTKAAAVILIDEIQDGVPVNEAVTAFCQEIIHGAGL